MGDVSKLPKWAQWEIERLSRDLEYQTEKARTFFGGEKSRVRLEHFPQPLEECFIPSNTSVAFQLADGWVRCHLDQDGTLCVSGDDAISLRPRAANLVWVRRP